MRVAVCQTPEIIGDTGAAIRVAREFAGLVDADLMVFPEGFLQGYLVTEGHVQRHAVTIGSPR